MLETEDAVVAASAGTVEEEALESVKNGYGAEGFDRVMFDFIIAD
ncbi:hypothetical protein AB0F85_02575 [Nocardia fluminea]